ncbi:hypothetical protein GIB67_007601 [Kingdonia uniflora]|uniref:DUF674 family protein n=1 Tax=Kingdonia uniflora TaxID=39325 RepID=A0A7J7N1Q4_9MAGN|nr:hypothetical protein GIB67_007601 [Kingdonia uniflora]
MWSLLNKLASLAMGANHGNMITIKVVVDKKRNRVIFVEAGKDFVDILFSFLTLPVGTIIRLTNEQTQPTSLGCMRTLYECLLKFDTFHFVNTTCKEMLLRPRNSSEALCRKLKVNIDDTEPTKYYVCNDFLSAKWDHSRTARVASAFRNIKCSCSKLMDKEVGLDGKVSSMYSCVYVCNA